MSARTGQILLKLLLTLIGFFGLAPIVGVTNITPFDSHLVGCSLDSFAGLFGAILELGANWCHSSSNLEQWRSTSRDRGAKAESRYAVCLEGR